MLWDGTGLVLVTKRLASAALHWPAPRDSTVHLTALQLWALLEGLDWRRVHGLRPVVPLTVVG